MKNYEITKYRERKRERDEARGIFLILIATKEYNSTEKINLKIN